LQRLVDSVAVPDGVLEGARAVVILHGGAAAEAVLDALDAAGVAGRLGADEGAAVAAAPGEVAGHVAELGREVRGGEQEVHGRTGGFGVQGNSAIRRAARPAPATPPARGKLRGLPA